MLLIDPGRTIVSLPEGAAPFPWLPKDFHDQPLEARFFLARAGGLDRVAPLLLNELATLGLVQRIRVSLPMLILADAAEAVARGQIRVGQPLNEPVTLVFQAGMPVAKQPEQAVRFARQQAAVDFLRPCLMKPAMRSAIDAALTHPRGAQISAPSDPAQFPGWLANLLLTGRLGLFPLPGVSGGLRIAWIDRLAPTAGTPAASSPPPSPPPPPPPPAAAPAAASPVPDLPAQVSPQAQTLLDASQSGAPFCEECAKAAAAAAADGGADGGADAGADG